MCNKTNDINTITKSEKKILQFGKISSEGKGTFVR